MIYGASPYGTPQLIVLPVVYTNYELTQKRAAMAINTWKLTQVYTGAIGFKGCKNFGRIQLSGVKS